MHSRRRTGVVLGLLAVLLAALIQLGRDRPEQPPTPAAPAREPARSSTTPLTPLRLSPAVSEPAAAEPCVRGTVRSAASDAPVARAELLFETSRGASAATTDGQGNFEALLPQGALRLASISAVGFHSWAPEWGHSPLLLTPQPGRCVTGLLFFLAPRVDLTGTVRSLDRQPVAGARVVVYARNRPASPPLSSNAEGEVHFEAPDEALVVATHPDFLPGRAEVDAIASVTRELTVVLGPRRQRDAGLEVRVLRGLVLDAAGVGLPGALVTLTPSSDPDAGASTEAQEQTSESDERGAFSFTVSEPGPWTIGAEAESLVPDSRSTSGEPVELHLLGGGAITGSVTDTQGQPIASFAISIAHRDGAFERWPPRVLSFVDPSGRFTVRGVEPGASVVSAAAFGLASAAPVTVEVSAGATSTVALKLGRGAALTGRVTSRDGGLGLEGARISLEGSAGSGLIPLLAETRSAAGGAFTLTGIPPGRHSVFVAAANHDARLLPPRDFEEARTEGPVVVDLGPIPSGQTPQVELQGIGAVLKAVGEALVLQQVVPGAGAAEAGLLPGDAILTIDGTPVAALGFVGGIERLRGPENTTVDLTVRRAAAVSRVAVPRRRIVR